MWHKVCAFFLSAVVLCGSTVLAFQRWKRAEQKLWEYTISADQAVICKYTGEKEFVNLPEEINGKKVTAVCGRAFYENHTVQSVQFPACLQSIGEYAFYGCDKMEELVLPPSIRSIGRYAFSQCPNLTKVKIPRDVKLIGEGAFSGMLKLENVEIAAPCRIGEAAFADCPNLKTVAFAGSVSEIEKEAFFNDPALRSVTLPDTVSFIGERAFGYVCGQTIGSFVRASDFMLYAESEIGREYILTNGF